MIKKYSEFISEKYQVTMSNPPEITSDMNSYNDLEENINSFNKYKTDIRNIYMNYKDNADLINKLSSKDFIDKKTQDADQIKFKYSLLSFYAQYCQKERELNDSESVIKKLESDISNEQKNMGDPALKEVSENNIKQTKEEISKKRKDIEVLKREIMDKQKKVNDTLKTMKDNLSNTKNRLDVYNTQKMSNPIPEK